MLLNIGRRLSDIPSGNPALLLNFPRPEVTLLHMRHALLPLILALLLPAAAQAQCYAEYKAKQDNPLRLHYGILVLDSAACPGPAAAERAVAQRLSGTGWTLLNVVGLSQAPPSDQQRANAGDFFLRF